METNKESRYEKEETENKAIVSFLVEKELKEKYARILAQQHDVHREKETKAKGTSYLPWLKYAAALILVFSSIIVTNYFLNEVTPQQLASEYVKDTHLLGDPSSMRKDNAYVEQLRIDANYAFINKNFDESIRSFEKLVLTDQVQNSDYFYLGVSYLKGSKPQPKSALDAFDKVASDSPLRAETNWFMALAFLLDKDEKNALSILNKIVKSSDFKHREAKKILDRLNK